VVGTTKDYPTFNDFVTKRIMRININEVNGGSGSYGNRKVYELNLNDTVEGIVTNSVSLA
jgi:hypothetical protein